ncbi:MAG: ZIP family metal transporter [bacterium]
MQIAFILATLVSTIVGGLVALKFKDRRHLLLGFTAGVLLSVVAFDLLPEIFSLAREGGHNPRMAMIALVVGFLVFHIAEKVFLVHHSHEADYGEHHHPTIGSLSAGALILHSFFDGVGIGLGFQASTAIGIVIALAVIAHDFSDGLNTVSLMLAHNNSDKKARKFLVLDAVAPVLGGLSTLFFTFSSGSLIIYLGFFTGFLIYMGASDILPEAHSKDSSLRTVVATIVGVVFMYVVTGFLAGL